MVAKIAVHGSVLGALRHTATHLANPIMRATAVAALLATIGISPAARAQTMQAQTTINFYGLGDTNVADLWTGTMLPDFEKAYPQYKVKFVDLLHGNGAQGLIDRIVAARAGKQPDLDVFEGDPPGYNYPLVRRQPIIYQRLTPATCPISS